MKNNVLSRLSPQWLCGNSFTWAYDIRASCQVHHVPKNRTSFAQVNELPQSLCGDNWEGTLFS